MATLTLTASASVATRIQTAICNMRGYTGFEADGTTPQTQMEFVRKYLMDILKKEVVSYEAEQAAATAANTAIINGNSQIIIT